MTILINCYENIAQQQVPSILNTHLSVNSILPLLPDYFFVLSILNLSIFFVLSLVNSKQFINFDKINQKNVGYLSILTVLLYLFLISKKHFLLVDYLSFNCFICNNFFTTSLKIFIIISVLIYLILSNYHLIENRFNIFEYYILVLTATLGFLLLISSNELIIAYLSIEVQSLALYVLAASKTNSSYSIESWIKYFFLGSTSSIIFLFGMDLVYSFSRSLMMTDFTDLFLLFSPAITITLCQEEFYLRNFSEIDFFNFRKKIFLRAAKLSSGDFYITEKEFCELIFCYLIKLEDSEVIIPQHIRQQTLELREFIFYKTKEKINFLHKNNVNVDKISDKNWRKLKNSEIWPVFYTHSNFWELIQKNDELKTWVYHSGLIILKFDAKN